MPPLPQLPSMDVKPNRAKKKVDEDDEDGDTESEDDKKDDE